LILKLELIDDAGTVFGNEVHITDMNTFPLQVGQVCLAIRQMVQAGKAKFVPPTIVIASGQRK